MVADFKSHVLSRDEKGFLGIPFKRLLLAGVGGGMLYTIGKFAFPDWAIPVAVAAGGLLIVFTATQGGIPRWQRLVYRLRGNLMLAAATSPNSFSGSLARLIELPAELAVLDADTLFAPPPQNQEANLTEWVTFAKAQDADHDDGLMLVDALREVEHAS